MCFIDPSWANLQSDGVSRRQFLGTGLAAGLAATAVDWGKSLLLPGLAEGAEQAPKSGGPGSAGVNFKWFGTDGWEITFGNKTILFDPWFSRFDTGFFAGKFNAKTPIKVEEALIDQHIKKADHILIGHGHWDHLADIPYIAKKTNAQVIGSETHANVMRAFGVAEGKIVQVKGGEFMQFDGYTIETYFGAIGSLWTFVATMMSLFGGAPLGAAGVVILLILVLAAYVVFVAGLWLIRFAARRIPAPVPAARPDDRSLSDVSAILTAVAFAFLVVTAFLPIVVAAAFSFNGSDSMSVFGGWSPRWYHSFGQPEVTGLLEREDFRDLLFRSLGFAALVSGVATPLAILAAATIHILPPRTRAAIRGVLYFGMAIPLVMYGSMTIFARHVAAAGYPVVPAEDAWAVVPVFLTYLPLALGVSFVVAASSASWRQAFYLRSMPFAWIRPAAGGFLISMAFVMSAYAGIIGESATVLPIAFLARNIATPIVDASLAILAAVSLTLLATGWVVRGDDERFRF